MKAIVTITGPSTVGKSTLSEMLVKKGFEEIVSTTTRPPRSEEKDGKHYYFVSNDEFDVLLKNNEMVEHINVAQYKYGVSIKAIEKTLKNNENVVLVVEPNGANQVEKYCNKNNIKIYKIFIDNPIEILIERLQKRYDEDTKRKDDVYRDRLWNMVFVEPKEWVSKAYSGEHRYDMVCKKFDKSNQQEILEAILLLSNNQQKNIKIRNK